METSKEQKIPRDASRFKSYYVVWKPPRDVKEIGIDILFKSYYVVWKRLILGVNAAFSAGLNRTM